MELGITVARVSQMRTEAMVLLRNAINAQLDPELVPNEPTKRMTKRRASYYAAVAADSDYRRRFELAAGRLAHLASKPAVAISA